MVGLRSTLGILRSVAMYYGIPGRQARMRRFYSQFMGEKDLAFDVGSHVGNRIKAWTALGANVVAIEPQPHLFKFLKTCYGKNPKVYLVPHGVGSRAGKMDLFVSSRTPTVSTFSRDWIDEVQKQEIWQSINWDEKVSVNVETLDQLIARYGRPRFCKIDVEGFELDVLEGLNQPIPALSFEFIPASQDRALNCIRRIESIGDYEFNWSAVETMRWKEPEWVNGEVMAARLLAMPKGGRSGDVYARLRG